MTISEKPRLKINEIFISLQGETKTTGFLTTFIRLTGCPLRCRYCDTEYAFEGGEWQTIEQIIQKVTELGSRRITVTGGEPLAQKRCILLLEKLIAKGFDVSLETSGAMSIADVPVQVSRVVDLKTPASQESARNLYENIALLSSHDQVKFVICNHDDYLWSKKIMKQYALNDKCEVLFSPVQLGHSENMKDRDLAQWIIDDRLDVRFQIQLHKLLWGDESGR